MDETERKIFGTGLTAAEALKRLSIYGKNHIETKKSYDYITLLVRQFNNFLILLLIAAGAVAFAFGDRLDAGFIFLIAILNVTVSLFQEYKSEKALESLSVMTTAVTRVIRDGRELEIDSKDVVPGDIVYIEEGTRVPADGITVFSHEIEVDESTLTGESLPVAKNTESENEIFMGTIVVRGRGYFRIEKTGMQTKFGQIAVKLASIPRTETKLQKKLGRLTQIVGFVGIVAATLIFGITRNFIFGISVAVAAVPEGLPAVMTITLAIGVERMARKKAIVRQLNAIETLGNVTLVATDKTGTLTTNQMRVKKVWKKTEKDEKMMLLAGVLSSTASLVQKIDHGEFDVLGDRTEGALLHWAHEKGLNLARVKEEWSILVQRPFDAKSRSTSAVVQRTREKLELFKGAPEYILELSNVSASKRITIQKEFTNYARSALRIIAFGYKKPGAKMLTFLGFVGISDPVRPEILQSVRLAHTAGIKTVMITGDNPLTAEAIGVETGIIHEGEDILTGVQIDGYSDEQLREILGRVRVFARMLPEHKYRLVKLYQQMGEVVAVTGDGVNDALAIKQADCGIAMGKIGTDVARQTADVILADDNYATIIAAIEEGRNIFVHLKSAIKFLLACNLGEVLYIVAAAALNLPIFTPLLLIYINLITDGLPAIAFAFAPPDPDIMKKKPVAERQLLHKRDLRYLLSVGVLMAGLAYVATLPYGPGSVSSTALFTALIALQYIVLFDCWVSHKPIFANLHLFGNKVFLVAVAVPVILHPLLLHTAYLQALFGTVALSAKTLAYCVALAGILLTVLEMHKLKRVV